MNFNGATVRLCRKTLVRTLKAVCLLVVVFLACLVIAILRTDDYDSLHNSGDHVSENDTVDVVTTCDKKTLGGMIALINSITRNTNHSVHFHIITDEATYQHAVQWIENTPLKHISYEMKIFPLQWIKGRNLSADVVRPELSAPLNLARFFLPNLFPNLTGRIVYLDNDIIVLGDIFDLYRTDIWRGHLGAFAENPERTYERCFEFKHASEAIKNLNFDPEENSFNAGVFVSRMDVWRQHNLTDKLMNWVELNAREGFYGTKRSVGVSQQPLLLEFYRKYSKIDPKWHFMNIDQDTKKLIHQPIGSPLLLHWNGHFKPWSRYSCLKELWQKYFIEDPKAIWIANKEKGCPIPRTVHPFYREMMVKRAKGIVEFLKQQGKLSLY